MLVLKYILFYIEGVGWIVLVIVGMCFGFIVSIFLNKNKWVKRCFFILGRYFFFFGKILLKMNRLRVW